MGSGLKRCGVALVRVSVILALVSVLALISSWREILVSYAHNLQTRMVYAFFDRDTQDCFDARIEGQPPPAGCLPLPPGWQLGDPLLQVGDEVGVIIKVVPRDGTTTGVGGHIDFYIPDGVQVVDVAYVIPDGSGGYERVGMKGQSPIAIGAGPIGAKATPELIGLSDLYFSAASGLSSQAVDPATGLHLGTIAGLYGDTGIFYSTDPDTAYGSWQKFTGDWNAVTPTANRCGSAAFATVTGETIVNNSKDIVVPCNKWDAGQLMAWGAKGGTYGQAAPIVDYVDGRGNAPWGFASGVAGPQSGYAWNFNWDEWNASAKDAAAIRAAMGTDEIGPWQRIRYDGDRISYDQPGLVSTVLGFANKDAGNSGVDVSTLGPTVSQTDTTSPKAIRWAVGQLTAFRPEYAWVKLRVTDQAANISTALGCPQLRADTFGGDAGGTDNGKDHLWRYYEPTEVRMDLCAAVGKPATEQITAVGSLFQYPIKVYNLQNITLTNVVVKDTLGSGLTLVSSVPAQDSGPNPLVWNVGTLLPGQKFEALLTVQAAVSGFLDNCVEMTSDQLEPINSCETTISGAYPFLVPTKTANVSSIAPGGTVLYDVRVLNTGTGPTKSPVSVHEYLPPGFSYDPTYTPTAQINGATVTPTVNASNPNEPVFTVNAALQAERELTIRFRAKAAPNIAAGEYCNTYSFIDDGVPITTGSLACVTVGGAKIGDRIWRDWDGDGVQDADEEGIAGITVNLYAANGTTLLATTTTDANGNYYFTGLSAGTYVVKVNGGATPAGYTQTGDPDQPGTTCTTCDNSHTVTLIAEQEYLTADFGYRPTGTASIGDKVFEDINKDGIFNGSDTGIPNVTVWLYEDSNGNGVIDAGVDALVATTTSNGSGDYTFANLAGDPYDYLVKVDKNDPDIQSYFNTKYGGTPPYELTTAEVTYSPNLTGADLDNDFGFWRVSQASIGDQVYFDADKSGTYNAGDTPLANVTVRLYASDGTTLLATTSSAADGTYHFTGLSPGTYVVKVDTTDPDIPGFLGGAAGFTEYTVPLIADQVDNTRDFPFVAGTLITKAVDKAVADPGGTLTYTLTPDYTGSDALTSLKVIDYVPTGTTFVSAGQGGSNVPPVTWNLGTTTAAINGSTTISGASTITYVASTTANGTGGSLTPSSPTSTAKDVIIAALSWDSSNGATIAPQAPAGWTQIGSGTEATASTAQTIGYVAESDANGQHSNPAAAAIPAGTVAGDVLIAAVEISNGHQDQGYSTITTPTGWTLISRTNLGTSGSPLHSLLIYWRVATASTPTPTWVTSNSQEHWAVGIVAYRNVDNTAPINAQSAQTNASSTTVTAPSITTTVANTVLVGVFASGEDVPVAGTTNMVFKRVDVVRADAGGGNNGQHIIMGEGPFVGPGATGTRTATIGTASPNIGALIALKPAGSTIKHKETAYWHAYTGTESAGWNTFTMTGSAKWTLGFSAYRGVDNSTPINVQAAQANASSTSAVAPTITTTVNNTRLVGIFASKNGTPVASPPGGMTERTDASTAAGGTSEAGLEMADATFATAGATGTRTATLTAATINIGHLIALKPAPWSYTATTSLSSSRSLVKTGDSITVTMDVTATTLSGNPPFPITVTPGALSVTGTNGSSASFGAASPATQSLTTSGVGASFTYSSSSVTPGSTPGVLTFKATPSDPNGTWAQGTANTTLITPPLTYSVTVNSPDSPGVVKNTAQITSGTNGDGGIPTATSNEVSTLITNSIGDTVFLDANGNGVQDPGETGMAGVRVYVDSNGNGQYDPGERSDVTDYAGLYRIGGLAAGTYTVRVDTTTYPAGYIPTTDAAISRTLTGGDRYDDVDFGFQPPPPVTGSIGDYIWLDADEDGVQDAGEAPLPGITVRLYRDLDGDGVLDPSDPLVATDVTDAGGAYSFTGLPFDDYIVVVDETSPVTSPYDPLGSYTLGGVMDSTADTYDATANGVSAVTVSSSTPITDVDFGYNWAGQIGDRTWYDTDRDGVQGAGEASAAFVTMVLYSDSNGNGKVDPGEPVVAVVETNASGAYLVDNLPPGNYVMDPDEQTVQNPETGAYSQMVPSTGEYLATTLTEGDMVDLDVDAGFFAGAAVEGYVYHDVDSSGTKDAGEPGLANVTVTLTGTDDQGNAVSETTTTNASGEYAFLVPPGSYTISYDTADADIPAALGTATTPTSTTFTAVGGQEYSGDQFNFGRDNTGSIGDLVWNDADGDGFKDGGESGIPGVTLQLYTDPNGDGDPADGVLIDSQATDANGKYIFDGLADGNYVVVVDETALSGYTQTGDPDEGMATCVTCDARSGATVTSGGATLGEDFGYQTPGYHVAGTLWNDNGAGGGTAGDGVQNGTEPGIAGVTVCIYEDDGVTLVACTTTAGNGDYEFSGIPDGDYIIRVDDDTLPSDAFGQTGDPDATKDNQTSITVAGAPVVDKDFGYREYFGSISGTVVGTVANPADGDGVAEAGEGAQAGVTVFLTYAGNDGILGTADDVVSSALTDGAGNYSFINLEPGIYQVTKTNPAGYTSLADSDAGNPNNVSVILDYGPDGIPGNGDDRMISVDNDFEVEPPSGSIGDSVWLDVDRDGIQDIGEPGIANVTVELAPAYAVADGAIDLDGLNGVDANDDGWLRGIRVINGYLDLNGDGTISSADSTTVTGTTFFGTPVVNGALDLNRDGSINSGGILDDGSIGGDTIATEVTDLEGHYLFTDVAAGDYLVFVHESTLPGAPGSLTEAAGTLNPQFVSLMAGETDLDVDFGYVSANKAIIGDFVWSDANNDGVQDPGEPGIGGVTLALKADLNNDGFYETTVATTTTAADGSYYFFGVDPGKYKVDVTDTGGVLGGYTLTSGPQSSTDPSAAITVLGTQVYDQADFGYYNPNLYSISDLVWYDANRNGIEDPGEVGISGVTVDLVLDENGDGVSNYDVIGGRIDVNGDGKIDTSDDTGMAATLGGYEIIDGFVDINDDGVINVFDDGTYNGYPVIDGVIDLNGSGTTADNLGSIGDSVWLDSDGDGLRGATEVGLSGVTVYLCASSPCTSGNAIATTETDAKGNYLFPDLGAGTYYVGIKSTDVTDLTATTNVSGTTTAINLAAGQNYLNADFGFKPDTGLALIGDRIWSDADGDGRQDPGEAGIGGVTVELRDGVCTPGSTCPVVTTDSDGSYLFKDVAAGTYTVVVTDTGMKLTGYTQTGDPDQPGIPCTVCDGQDATVTVSAGQVYTTSDFGYRSTTGANGVVGDTVYEDTNGNGIQDPGEEGIVGVTINLYSDPNQDGNPSDGVLIATTTTGADGSYSFSGLPVSAGGTGYVVEVSDTRSLLANAYPTADPDETGVCSTCNNRGSAVLYTTGNGTGPSDNTLDFGYYFEDNGTISPEPIIATAISDQNGSILFDGLPNGDYVLAVSDNSGELVNFQGTTPEAQAGQAGVTISNADVLGENFGYAGLGPIGDTVFSDHDGDGFQDAGEPGIAGVQVKLYLDDGDGVFEPGSGDILLSTQTTDASGTYYFNDLPAGTFWVSVDDTQGVLSGYSATTTDGHPATGSSTEYVVALSSSAPSFLDADFGYQKASLADVSGSVFNDPNKNAVFDAGETGFEGVTVVLVDTMGNIVASTTTDASGNYIFWDVAPGNYRVEVTDDEGILADYELTSGLDSRPITVAGANITDIDFGYVRKSGTGSIGDTVFLDSDGNGVQNGGESGIAGVPLELAEAYEVIDGKIDVNRDGVINGSDDGTLRGVNIVNGLLDINGDGFVLGDGGYVAGSDNGTYFGTPVVDGLLDLNEDTMVGADDGYIGGNTIATTVTNAQGQYLFDGLAAGDYLVLVNEAAAALTGKMETTGDGDGISSLVSLADGETDNSVDFGYIPSTASIGDHVWYDADGDGIQDPGELGIPGVTVYLCATSPCTAGNALQTAVTDANGNYLFSNLAAGTYTVAVNTATLPGGYSTTPTNGAASRTVSLTQAQILTTVDFGFNGGTAGTIGDLIFLDSDRDGIRDVGEPGLSGVTVSLYDDVNGNGVLDSGEPMIGSTVTNANGAYSFTGVPVDADGEQYLVVVTDLNNVLTMLYQTADPDQAGVCTVCNDIGAVTLTSAAPTDNTVDFGYATPGLGSLGGTVWRDINQTMAIGILDAGEPGIGGVTVELWLDNNNNGIIEPGVDNLIRTTVTDANGDYLFNGLPAGNYIVNVTDDHGVLAGFQNVLGPAPTADNNGHTDPFAVTLAGGVTNTTVDFGYEATTPLSLSGTTFYDLDFDGVLDGTDVVQGGLTLYLYRDLDGDGVVDPNEPLIATTVSDVNGDYIFTDLAGCPTLPTPCAYNQGSYIVTADANTSLLSGMTQSTQVLTGGVEPVQLGTTSSADHDFGFGLTPTLVVVESFRAYPDSGQAVVEWVTALEAGTLGFHVQREDPESGRFVNVNEQLLPGLLNAPQGGTYRFVDTQAWPGQTYTYRLVEVEFKGGMRIHGPFTVRVAGAGGPPIVDRFEKKAKQPSALEQEKAKKAKKERDAVLAAAQGGKGGGGGGGKDKGKAPLKIYTVEEGLHFVSAAQIAGGPDGASAVVNSIKKGEIALSNMGQPVDWLAASDSSGIYFYAQKLSTVYTDENVYWLTWAAGNRMDVVGQAAPNGTAPEEATFRQSLDYEEDLVDSTYFADDPHADFWYWNPFCASSFPGFCTTYGLGQSQHTYTIATPGAAASAAQPATLTVRLQGGTDLVAGNDHHVRVTINGEWVGDLYMVGTNALEATLSFDQSILNNGDNQVVVTGLSDLYFLSLFYLDGMEVSYQRLYEAEADALKLSAEDHGLVTVRGLSGPEILVLDISDPWKPVVETAVHVAGSGVGGYSATFVPSMTDAEYLVLGPAAVDKAAARILADTPSSLQKAQNQADSLVIAPFALNQGAQALANYRSVNYQTYVAYVEDIFDEFSYGIVDHDAIREFLAFAHSHWKKAPKAVTFVGDGSWDFKNIKGFDTNVMPVILTPTPWGVFASDSRYVDVVDNDGRPEMAFGRISALTSQDVLDYIQKLQAYESAASGAWESRVILLADNPDEAGSFHADTDAVAAYLPSELEQVRIYHVNDTLLAQTRQAVLTAWNAGSLMFNYIGHGANQQLGPNTAFLKVADVAGLTNGSQMPLFAALTCAAGDGAFPGVESLAEALVKRQNGGAIAALAPTGLSLNDPAVVLNKRFVEALFGTPDITIGEALVEALNGLADTTAFRFMLDIYGITGDPLVKLK